MQVTGNINLKRCQLDGQRVPNLPLGDLFTIIKVTGGTHCRGRSPRSARCSSAGRKFIVEYNYTLGTVVLERELASATVNITSSDNPSLYGEPIVFTVTVVPEPGGGAAPANDTVTFTFDGKNYGATTLNCERPGDVRSASGNGRAAGGGRTPSA